MGERVTQLRFTDWGTAEGATPATAQAQGPLAQANLESADYMKLAQRAFISLAHLWERDGERGSWPPKGHTTQVVISQVSGTDGAQHEAVLRLFHFSCGLPRGSLHKNFVFRKPI